MGKRKVKAHRYIIGVMLNERMADPGIGFTYEIIANFIGAAWTKGREPKIPCPTGVEIVVDIESEHDAEVEFEDFKVSFITTERFRQAREHCLVKETAVKKESENETTVIDYGHAAIVGVGSREFCEAWIKFWAFKSGRLPKWSQKMINHLKRAEDGSTIWYDADGKGNVYTSHIITMAEEFESFQVRSRCV